MNGILASGATAGSIAGLGSSTAAGGAGTTPLSRNGQRLGQDDFLRLMTKQLTTQDPFNPVDNTQMVAQMAQFSQVSGIEQVNSKLATLIDLIGGTGTYAPPIAASPPGPNPIDPGAEGPAPAPTDPNTGV